MNEKSQKGLIIDFSLDDFRKKFSREKKLERIKQIKKQIEKMKMVDALKIPIKKNKNSATKGEMLGQKLYEKCLLKKKRKEHSDMEEILKKRIKEEKINRDYINNILERNQVITNLILKK